jgi:hypothetical protein
MNQQNNNPPNTSSFVLGVVLFFIIVMISSAPAVIGQMNRPERLLSRAEAWNIIARSTRGSVWEASDGSSAKHVSIQPDNTGFKVMLQPVEMATRQAFFHEGLIPTDTFKLSVEVKTPTACHNGLVFRGNPQGEYYLFLVSSSSYTVEILRRDSDHDLPREALIPNTTVSNRIGQPHILSVIGRRGTYYFYINGTYVDQMSDSRLSGNRVGVEAFT